MSTNTGVPPALCILPAVAKKVNGVVITSSPGFRFNAFSVGSRSSEPPRGNAAHQSIGRHVGGDDGARANEGVFTQRDAADDRGVRPDRATAPHEGAAVFVLARQVAARIHDVREDAGGPAEDVVFQ